MHHQTDRHLPWQFYLARIVEFLLTFSLASFCIAMYFSHRAGTWTALDIILIGLYLFVTGACTYNMMRTLPIALLMLMIPLIPLVPVVLVLIFIPLLQQL